MNTMSESRADAPANTSPIRRVLVWDAPVRLFHWLMVASFAGAWLSAESEAWRLVHVTLGYTMAGLVAFRLVWGLYGTRYARFSSFVRTPQVVSRYFRTMLTGRPEPHLGHNPLGGLAILALLGLALTVTASGWAVYNDIPGRWPEEAHELVAGMMLMIVGMHIGGVLLSSWLHRDNLVAAMLTGRKPGRPEQGIRRPWRSVAVLMLAGVVGFWWLQWQSAPAGSGYADVATVSARFGEHGRDDD